MGLARGLLNAGGKAVKGVSEIAVGIAGDSAKMLSAFFRMIDPDNYIGVSDAVDSAVDSVSNVANGVVDTTVNMATGASELGAMKSPLTPGQINKNPIKIS